MDREKAIKGMHQHCEGSLFDRCGECPYYEIDFSAWEESKFKCRDELLSDALDLLKEQEAKEVRKSTNMYTGLPITHCPKCGISLDRYLYGRQYEGQINYCPMCGQKVKWV